MTGTGGISPWSTYGDNSDDAHPPVVFAGADFYNLYERLYFDDEPAIGFDSLVRVARLPRILPGVQTFQVSSFDRTEGNTDGGSNDPGLESYFYREGDAEVVLEASGPGQISRIWFAKSNDPGFANTRIQFFFDGADQVSYEIPVTTMMSGTTPPFVAPLVLNADRSSGGLISYVPIPFREGVKVRLIGAHVHYQVTYQLFADAGNLQTFTGLEDYTLAQHLWQRLGQDPKPTSRQPEGDGHRTNPARRQPGAGPNEQLRRAQQPAAPIAAAGTVDSRHTTAGRYGARPSPR